jgi:hypothetical protein
LAESESYLEVSLDLGGTGVWTNYKALGYWKRNGEGEDGKVAVYLPGRLKYWDEAYGAKFGENPNGLPQTEIVLEPERAKYIDTYTS